MATSIRRYDQHHLILGDLFNGNRPLPDACSRRSSRMWTSLGDPVLPGRHRRSRQEMLEHARHATRADRQAAVHPGHRELGTDQAQPASCPGRDRATGRRGEPSRDRAQNYIDSLSAVLTEPWFLGWHWCSYFENLARGWGIEGPVGRAVRRFRRARDRVQPVGLRPNSRPRPPRSDLPGGRDAFGAPGARSSRRARGSAMFTFGAEIRPYHDYSLDVALGELAGLGFTHVNLWSSRAALAHHVNPGDDVAAIRRLLRTHGMTPTGLTLYGHDQAGLLRRIELAAELGIDTVIFDCEANSRTSSDPVAGFVALVRATRRGGSPSRTTCACRSPRTSSRAATRATGRSEGVDTFSPDQAPARGGQFAVPRRLRRTPALVGHERDHR